MLICKVSTNAFQITHFQSLTDIAKLQENSPLCNVDTHPPHTPSIGYKLCLIYLRMMKLRVISHKHGKHFLCASR